MRKRGERGIQVWTTIPPDSWAEIQRLMKESAALPGGECPAPRMVAALVDKGIAALRAEKEAA